MNHFEIERKGATIQSLTSGFASHTGHFWSALSHRYYHFILEHRLKAGRVLKEGTMEAIPGWPFPYTKEKR